MSSERKSSEEAKEMHSHELPRMQFMEGWSRPKDGGLLFEDPELIRRQKGVLMDVLRDFGAQVLSGKGNMTLSLPIRIFEPKSALQRMTCMWQSIPSILPKIRDATDNVERMKYVLALGVSGLHLGLNQWKPFNPILGETYQGTFPDGSHIFIEQTSHHPPVSNFLIEGEGWTVHGVYHWQAGYSGNAVVQHIFGPTIVHIEGCNPFHLTLPFVRMNGAMMGDRVVEWRGHMIVEEKTEGGLKADIDFEPVEGSWIKTRKEPIDLFEGHVTRGEEKIMDIEGSWLSHLTVGGDRVWDLAHEPIYPANEIDVESSLESDCRRRTDLVALEQGDLETAQTNKLELEHIQRMDKKHRTREEEERRKRERK